ncbi:unnamed protein product [[Candida] boidinii]|uniref:Unnamed protein product n=1 Tax=Candida boidinii TaxID=5477 RepID=A0ACB5TPJ9_CANBO|nr:unnamed protein product [[Candida] boidinii]
MTVEKKLITIGVLSLQGSYIEHISHLEALFEDLKTDSKYDSSYDFKVREVKTIEDLEDLSGLIFPGGESTTMSILLQRNNLLEPIRELVQIKKLPCWGTCAGLILLSNEISNTKIDLGGANIEKSMKYRVIGGLNVQIQRNSFGRQLDSFNKNFKLDNFTGDLKGTEFSCLFIRAPVIKKILFRDSVSHDNKEDNFAEHDFENGIVRAVELDKNNKSVPEILLKINENGENELIVAIKQDNIFGTSFHPELVIGDYRMHKWFLDEFVL